MKIFELTNTKHYLMTLVILLSGLLGTSHVHANMIKFYFQGVFTSVDQTLSNTFTTGETFSGTYMFDSSTPSEGSFSVINFSKAIKAMDFLSANYKTTGSQGTIYQDGEANNYYSANIKTIPEETIGNLSPLDMSLSWEESGILTNRILIDPNFDPDKPLYDYNGDLIPAKNGWFSFRFSDPTNPSGNEPLSVVHGRLTSVTVIPIPAAVWLFATGLLGIFKYRKVL